MTPPLGTMYRSDRGYAGCVLQLSRIWPERLYQQPWRGGGVVTLCEAWQWVAYALDGDRVGAQIQGIEGGMQRDRAHITVRDDGSLLISTGDGFDTVLSPWTPARRAAARVEQMELFA